MRKLFFFSVLVVLVLLLGCASAPTKKGEETNMFPVELKREGVTISGICYFSEKGEKGDGVEMICDVQKFQETYTSPHLKNFQWWILGELHPFADNKFSQKYAGGNPVAAYGFGLRKENGRIKYYFYYIPILSQAYGLAGHRRFEEASKLMVTYASTLEREKAATYWAKAAELLVWQAETTVVDYEIYWTAKRIFEMAAKMNNKIALEINHSVSYAVALLKTGNEEEATEIIRNKVWNPNRTHFPFDRYQEIEREIFWKYFKKVLEEQKEKYKDDL